MPIVVEKLKHSYMEGSSLAHDALRDIDLTVHDGEFLGLIGHTGSGKSTFVQHLNGLLQPTSGTVTVDGFNMADKKQRVQGRRLVGMVFQYPEYQLFEETV
ncbi:MAG: ATP-binding cassette domain-containing protein, partial [Clostridia bacterium]|nr:ATP-binding cassette domain-containing protein [Clostridia bacterium]